MLRKTHGSAAADNHHDRTPATTARQPSRGLLIATLAAMILGVVAGAGLDLVGFDAGNKAEVVKVLSLVTTIFLRLLRMIVAPLIFSTLLVGVSQMGGAGSTGRIGIRALAWFVVFSLVAICVGLFLGNLLAPGAHLGLTAGVMSQQVAAPAIDFYRVVEEMVPTSIAEAASTNKIIQIVIFAAFMGVAVCRLGENGALIRNLAEQVAAAMFKIAGMVMKVAPLAVFCAIAATTLEHGLAVIGKLGAYVADFYLGLAAMAVLLTATGFAFIGRDIFRLIYNMREALLIAFSTASSEATLPAAFEAICRSGVSRQIVGLVLPLGYAFNLAGTLVYSSFAVLFIAQAYGIALPLQTQAAILLFLLVANKGAAGVPRGALVTLTLTMQTFGLPVEGIALILGVEAIMDMGRTAINVLGNAIATASVGGTRPPPEFA